jgi:hypothetical protein
MRVVAAAVQFLAHHLASGGSGGGGGSPTNSMELLVQQTQAVVAGVQLSDEVHGAMVALAVLASSSFHTQAQHNYLVVALLPNQAVTSFTHSHLLAHLALCHL